MVIISLSRTNVLVNAITERLFCFFISAFSQANPVQMPFLIPPSSPENTPLIFFNPSRQKRRSKEYNPTASNLHNCGPGFQTSVNLLSGKELTNQMMTEKTNTAKNGAIHRPTREEWHKTDAGLICLSDFSTASPAYMAKTARQIAVSQNRDTYYRNFKSENSFII